MNKNLTNFIDTKSVKEDINYIKVLKRDNILYAVATDSFRLLEVKITDEFLLENLFEGFYSVKEWLELCKNYNFKKINMPAFLLELKKVQAMQENRNFNYPAYEKVIPTKVEDITSLDFEVNFNYLVDFLDTTKNRKNNAILMNSLKISKDKKMLYYKDDNIVALLMLMTK